MMACSIINPEFARETSPSTKFIHQIRLVRCHIDVSVHILQMAFYSVWIKSFSIRLMKSQKGSQSIYILHWNWLIPIWCTERYIGSHHSPTLRKRLIYTNWQKEFSLTLLLPNESKSAFWRTRGSGISTNIKRLRVW